MISSDHVARRRGFFNRDTICTVCAQRGSTVGKDSATDGEDATMRNILACHQGIYTERQMPNGVGGDVCATGGPDLRLVINVIIIIGWGM